MMFKRELIDELVSGRDAKDIFDRNGVLDKLKEALAERLAQSTAPRENVTRLPAGRWAGEDLASAGERDAGALLSRYRLRHPGFEDQIALLFARGLSVKDIKRRLEVLYSVAVPDELISSHAESVWTEASDWLHRALEPLYPIVVFDALRIKVRDAGAGRNKICHLALGLHPNGAKEVLGLWIVEQGASDVWLGILTDLKQRGVEDVLIFVNGGDRFRQAAKHCFPEAQTHTRIVELLRDATNFASSQSRAAVASALREIYCANDAKDGRRRLEEFSEGPVAAKYPAIAPLWERDWHDISPFFALPVEIRRVVASTFAVDLLQRNLKRVMRLRGQVDGDNDALALLYLVVRNGQRNWKRPQREWHAAKTHLAITFPDRFALR